MHIITNALRTRSAQGVAFLAVFLPKLARIDWK